MAFVNEIKQDNTYISSWKQNNPIPESLKQLTVEEFELVLRLASESLQSLRESVHSFKFQDVLTKKLDTKQKEHEKEFSFLQSQYTDEIKKSQKKLDKLETEKQQLQESYNLLQQNFLSLQNNVNQSIEKTFSCGLEKQNIFFSGQVSSIQKAFESRETMYKEQISELKQALEKYQKQSFIDQNSSNKGKQGEASFDSLVSQLTDWSLEDTSKIPDACDRQAKIRGCKTLFEIKNYSAKVPKVEVDKFKRNMELHKDAPLGVFISLKTQIVGGAQDSVYTEINSNNQILIYIQNFLVLDTETIFSVINNYIDMSQLFYSKIECLEENEDLQSKIDSIKPILNNSFLQITQMVNEINNHKKFMTNKINEQHSSIKLHIDKMKLLFESIVRVFFPEDTTTLTSMVIEEASDLDKPKKTVKRIKKNQTPTS